MPDFEWRFKEENDPDDLPPVERPKRRRRNWGRTIVRMVAVGLVAAAAAFLILLQRANEIADSITRDVLAVHTLAQRAIAQADTDLLDTILSHNDAEWRANERLLVEQKLLPPGKLLGLDLSPVKPVVDIRLARGFQEAEVTTDRTYIAQLGHGLTQTVVLRQVDVYRFDGKRWQWSQPRQDFWGMYQVTTGDSLSLDYPARDAEIALRLAADLDAVIDRFCDLLVATSCPSNLNVNLRLRADPYSLTSLTLPRTQAISFSGITRDAQQDFSLPAPSLLGAPIDEAGYQALYRFYAERVVGVVLVGLLSRDVDFLSYSLRPIVLDHYLIQLGVKPWPIERVTDREPAPIPLPDQDIMLLCVEGLTRSSLYRYSPAQDIWTKEFSGRDIDAMYPLPTGDGVILHARADGPTPARLTLWQNGRERLLFSGETRNAYIYAYGTTDMSGRNLLIGINILQGAPTMALLDINSCNEEGCAWYSLSSWPVWSPDGSQTILNRWQDGMLYRGDAQARQRDEIGEGYFPFWLDNETFGYVRLEHTAGTTRTWEIVATNIATDETNVLLGSEKLSALLPEDERDDDFGVNYIAVNPANPNLLLLTAYTFDRRTVSSSFMPTQYHGFLLDRQSGDVSLLSQPQTGWDTVLFSPDGRWLVMLTYDLARSMWTLTLRDVTTGETETFSFSSSTAPPETYPSFEWSAGGRWLSILNGGILHLIAPGYDYHQTIVAPSPGCTLAAWVNSR